MKDLNFSTSFGIWFFEDSFTLYGTLTGIFKDLKKKIKILNLIIFSIRLIGILQDSLKMFNNLLAEDQSVNSWDLLHFMEIDDPELNSAD